MKKQKPSTREYEEGKNLYIGRIVYVGEGFFSVKGGKGDEGRFDHTNYTAIMINYELTAIM